MKKTTTLAVLLALPALALAVGSPPASGTTPGREAGISAPPRPPAPDNPRAVRAYREQAIKRVGETARPLVDGHDDGAAALNNCSVETAQRFCEWYNSGGTDRIVYLDWILVAVARSPGGGSEAAAWCLDPDHSSQLEKPDLVKAYYEDPLRVALNIRTLPELAAELRAKKETPAPAVSSWPDQWLSRVPEEYRAYVVPGVMVLGLAALVAYRRRRRQKQAAT